MKRIRLARAIPLILAPLCAVAIAVPASASQQVAAGPAALAAARPDSASALAGYVEWLDPGEYGTYNSSGQSISVDNFATGQFQLTFDGLGGITGGDVQVTASDNDATCAVGTWGPNGANLLVNIYCFAWGTGSAETTIFAVTVTQPRSAPSGPYDYAYVYKAATSGTLTGRYQYNSAHKKNRVTHLGTGRYQVTLGGPRSSGTAGTVKVSPDGNEPGGCSPIRWRGTSKGQVVDVNCYTAAFTPQNRSFTLVYAKSNNLLGLNRQTDANAYADGSAQLYQPRVQYDSRRGARVTVVHYFLGQYEVLFAGSGSEAANANDGDLQVSAVGAGRQCALDGWSQQLVPIAFLYCTNRAGNLANTAFTVQWVVA